MSWIQCECGNNEHLNDCYIGRIYSGPCFACFKKMTVEEKEIFFEQSLEDRIISEPGEAVKLERHTNLES